MLRTRILLFLFVLAAAANAQTRPGLDAGFEQYIAFDEPVIAMRGVHLIDGTGAERVENQTIVIQGDRILAVGDTGEVDIPPSARVIDLEGHTVIPGIIGLHNHTFYTTSKRRVQLNYTAPLLYLASGVTTIRTTGSAAPYSELNLKRAVEEGSQIGPRLFVTGPYITGGSGMTYMTRLATPDDARRVVRYWAEEGVDWFKAYTLISQEELGAAIDEAHKLGIKVTGHLCSVSFKEAVALGIDNLEHGFFTNSDYDGSRDRNECPNQLEEGLLNVDLDSEEVKSTFQTMIDNDVPMTSTLAVYEMYVPGRPMADQRSLDAMSSEVREEYMNTYKQIQEQAGNTNYPYAAGLFEKAQAYEYAFVEAGGLLAAGVDPTGFGGALPGFGDQRNYLLLLEAGFAPAQVIQIMTLNGAKVLGIEETHGSVAPGKIADLVVIEGNPEANPEDISNVRYVFKEGRGYHSDRLVDAVNGLVGLR